LAIGTKALGEGPNFTNNSQTNLDSTYQAATSIVSSNRNRDANTNTSFSNTDNPSEFHALLKPTCWHRRVEADKDGHLDEMFKDFPNSSEIKLQTSLLCLIPPTEPFKTPHNAVQPAIDQNYGTIYGTLGKGKSVQLYVYVDGGIAHHDRNDSTWGDVVWKVSANDKSLVIIFDDGNLEANEAGRVLAKDKLLVYVREKDKYDLPLKDSRFEFVR
jgi:hypothetical protein